MRLTKTLGLVGALILAALVGGTLIGSALATDEPAGTGGEPDAAGYCDSFLDAFAAELGASTDEVVAAGKAAAAATIDAAVAAGDLSAERAENLKDRISDADADCSLFKAGWARGFGNGAAHGWARGLARGFLGGDTFEAAADALGIESSELFGQLREAGSLQALSEELGANYDEVTAAILAAVQADLDATELGDERVAQVIEKLSTWLEEGGEVGDLRPFGHRRDIGPDEPDASDAP